MRKYPPFPFLSFPFLSFLFYSSLIRSIVWVSKKRGKGKEEGKEGRKKESRQPCSGGNNPVKTWDVQLSCPT